MKIKMRTSAAGPDGNYSDGVVYDVPAQIGRDQALSFIRGGYAVVIGVPAPVEILETEKIEPVETAILHRGRGRPPKN